MKHAPVTCAHRELAYEIVGWNTGINDLRPWFGTGAESGIEPRLKDAAQLIADLEARAGRAGWEEGYEQGRSDGSACQFGITRTLNPYPELDP